MIDPPFRTTERVVLTLVGLVCTVGIALSRFAPEAFEQAYVVEDGWVEWSTVLALLAGALLCSRRFVRAVGRRAFGPAATALLLALAFTLGAGEELSWGQRVFGYGSTEFFRAHNTQGEMTLHNLQLGETRLNQLVFSNGLGLALLLWVLIVPLLYANWTAFVRRADGLAIPVLRARYGVALLALLLAVQVLGATGKRWELLEFGSAALLVLGIRFARNEAVLDGR
jgi:hypothetical protein